MFVFALGDCGLESSCCHINKRVFSWENLKETPHFQFIDYIFLLWNGREKQLFDLIARLNSRQPAIKFDLEYSKSSLEFLDTKICINNKSNKLDRRSQQIAEIF